MLYAIASRTRSESQFNKQYTFPGLLFVSPQTFDSFKFFYYFFSSFSFEKTNRFAQIIKTSKMRTSLISWIGVLPILAARVLYRAESKFVLSNEQFA